MHVLYLLNGVIEIENLLQRQAILTTPIGRKRRREGRVVLIIVGMKRNFFFVLIQKPNRHIRKRLVQRQPLYSEDRKTESLSKD